MCGKFVNVKDVKSTNHNSNTLISTQGNRQNSKNTSCYNYNQAAIIKYNLCAKRKLSSPRVVCMLLKNVLADNRKLKFQTRFL